MIKLIRYVKKYIGLVLVAVVLLFGQAILDLNLPNVMSNIINIGIQQSGIEEVAPQVIDPATMQLLEKFMDAEDAAAMTAAYTPYEELSGSERAQVDKTFPEAGAKDALVCTAEGDELTAAETAFSHGVYALMTYVQEAAAQSGQQVGESSEVSANFDLEQLQQLMPMLQNAPQAMLDDAIQKAQDTPATLTTSVAAVFDKAIYKNFGADTDKIQTNYIIMAGLQMLALSLAEVLCTIGAVFLFSRMGAGVARDLRRDVYGKVTGFTNAEMDRFSTASLITRTTNDVTQVQMLYTMGMRMLVYAPILGVGGVIMALRKSVGMSWIIGLAVGIILVIIGVLYVVVMPRFKRMQKLIDRLNLVSRENLTGIMVVRAFANQDFQEKRFEKANRDLTQNSLFVGRAIALMMPIMMFLMNGMSLLIVWVGADQISQSAMQVGDMMAFIQYSMQIIMAFLMIAMMFIMIPRASVSAERINEVLVSKSIVNDPEQPKTLGGKAKGEVAFHDVSFRYTGAEEDVLEKVSFSAKPGETTAFIGATGSGKSTLINLIPRFYDVSEGSVTLDGVDIRDLTQHELRENIGYVPQKGLLFSGDISSNLRFGEEDADSDTLRQAAEVAQATEFIDAMEDGFDTTISQGGTNVSGGQRQRLSIARALVKKAPVYIFDDSFSALDFATDAKLRTALKPYTKDSTVMIVAQRVSTIMHAEQIVVMDEGKVVGIGRHRELLENCPAYREIAESQLSKEELA